MPTSTYQNFQPTNWHYQNKQRAAATVASQLQNITRHYTVRSQESAENIRNGAILLPGATERTALRTVETMKRSWGDYRPDAIVCVEKDAAAAETMKKRVRSALMAVYEEPGKPAPEWWATGVSILTYNHWLKRVLATMPEDWQFTYADFDINGMVYARHKSEVGPGLSEYKMTWEAVRDFFSQQMPEEAIMSVTYQMDRQKRDLPVIAMERAAAAASNTTFSFRQVYEKESGYQTRGVYRGALAKWPTGDTLFRVKPESRMLDSDGEPYFSDTGERYDLPPAPTKRELSELAAGASYVLY